MVQNITTTCDRCLMKKEGEPALQLRLYRPDRETSLGPEKYDLCPFCLLDLVEWIKAGAPMRATTRAKE